MRPLTIILLIILVGGLSFFGFSVYKTRKSAPGSQPKATLTAPTPYSFKLKVGSNSVYVNNEPVNLDVPVKEIDGRVLVPLKFITDYLGAQNVNYDPITEEVTFDLELPSDKVPQKNTASQTTQDTTKTEDSLLTTEKKEKINSTASMSATFFKINKMESDGNTISIWIDLLMEPKTSEDVRKISDTFANDLSYIFDTNHDIKVVAIRSEPGKQEYKTFGTSRFKASTGKIDFIEENK